MKKVIIFTILAVVIAGGVFAQARAPNTVLGGVNVGFLTFGADVEYERTFPNLLPGTFAVAAEAGFTTVFIFPIFNVDVRARYYIKPDGNGFFADAGAGFGSFLGLASAIQFSGGAGWRFDIGQPNGWVLVPSLQYNYFLSLAKKDSIIDFGGSLIKLCVRMGYSF